MAPQFDKNDIGPWFGDLMFGTRTMFKYATSPKRKSQTPIVVGMALACHTEQTGGGKIEQMQLPENGGHNKGGPIEVDCSSTMILEIEVMPNPSFHNLPKNDQGETLVLQMDFPQGKLCSGRHTNRLRYPLVNMAM